MSLGLLVLLVLLSGPLAWGQEELGAGGAGGGEEGGVPALLQGAGVAAGVGNWEEAERQYREALSLEAESAEAALGLARALVAQGKAERAVAIYNHPALSGLPVALAELARLLAGQERHAEAATAYASLLVLTPEAEGARAGLAVALSAAGRPADAAAAWRDLLAVQPDNLEAHLHLARDLEADGRPEAAIEAYQVVLNTSAEAAQAAGFPDAERRQLAAQAALSLAPLLESRGVPEAAARIYLLLPALRPEADPRAWRLEAVRLLCAPDPQAAQGLLAQISPGEGESALMRTFIPVAACVADQLYDAGDMESAQEIYRRILLLKSSVEVDSALMERVRARIERARVQQIARRLALGEDRELTVSQRRQVERAQAAARQGQGEAALEIMRAVVEEARNSAEAWATLGDLQSELGRLDEAELSYMTAAAISPDDPRWRARLGLLLARAYGGRRHDEAVEELSRALRGPSSPGLLYERGVIYIGLHEWDKAIADLEAYLAVAPAGAHAEDARERLAALTRQPPEVAPPTITAPPMQGVSERAQEHYRLAMVYQDQEQPEQAIAEIEAALQEAPDWARAYGLLGDLRWDLQERDAAIAAWRRSLEQVRDPQVQVLLGVALLSEGQPQEAEVLFLAAAQAGAQDAYYLLADLAFGQQRYADARRWLDAYFAAPPGGSDYQTALVLRDRLDDRERKRSLALAGAGGVLLVGLGGWIWRRRRQRTLAELLAAAPESAHDLARLLAAIRHEVLKHNTTLLEEMAYAWRNRDHAALRWAAQRLFGADSNDDAGVTRRFAAYRAAIERLGKKHGVHLNLRRRDPVFAPMSRAMQRLARLEPALRSPERAPDLEVALHELHVALNQVAYHALGRLIQQMGTLRIDEPLLRAVDARVRAEPGLGEQSLPPLLVEGARTGLPARVFRGDFEDIVANLLRNAYLASIEGLADPALRRVALLLEEDDDPLTGQDLVVLRVCDQAPGALDTAALQGRDIGRGLGLTVDLVARHSGIIAVEAEPGWAKAVVVRLPRAEEEPAEATVREYDEDDDALAGAEDRG